MSGAVSTSASVSTPNLFVPKELVASVLTAAQSSGSIQTAIRLAASALSLPTVVAPLSTQIVLGGAVSSRAVTSSQVTTQIALASVIAATPVAEVTSLLTQIRLSGAVNAQALSAAEKLSIVLRQAQSIEDITLSLTIQQAAIAAFVYEPILSVSGDDIQMTASVEYVEA